MPCPDKHGAPCGKVSCRHCSPGYDDALQEIECLRGTLGVYRDVLLYIKSCNSMFQQIVQEALDEEGL